MRGSRRQGDERRDGAEESVYAADLGGPDLHEPAFGGRGAARESPGGPRGGSPSAQYHKSEKKHEAADSSAAMGLQNVILRVRNNIL